MSHCKQYPNMVNVTPSDSSALRPNWLGQLLQLAPQYCKAFISFYHYVVPFGLRFTQSRDLKRTAACPST